MLNYHFSWQEGLFQESGLIGEIQKIRDCLDTGMPETIHILCCFFICLILYFGYAILTLLPTSSGNLIGIFLKAVILLINSERWFEQYLERGIFVYLKLFLHFNVEFLYCCLIGTLLNSIPVFVFIQMRNLSHLSTNDLVTD